jgi:hypothetical protein
MGWKKTEGVAQFNGADWDNFIQKQSNCSPAEARRIARMNPTIDFFFFCNQNMVFEGKVYDECGPFSQNDAVFFSGDPWLGSAPQCDTYQKAGTTAVYLSPNTDQQVKEAGCYIDADGIPTIDFVCLFAANYCSDELPYLRANNNEPVTDKPFNPMLQATLENGSVQYLQERGIVVLLTIINGHSVVGWSGFKLQQDAQNFTNYLKSEVVDKYNLDGIDIDDKHSAGTANNTSLIMVSTLMSRRMPTKLITKALCSDIDYFESSWNGINLAQNLDFGWEMTYGAAPQSALPPYVKNGMLKSTVSKGFRLNSPSSNKNGDADWITQNGYGGIMVFGFESDKGVALAKKMVEYSNGANSWKKASNCPQY